jgi:hypothetical protein
MQIPKAFKLGKYQYTVQLAPRLRGPAWGYVYYDMQHISIATHSKGAPRPLKGRNGVPGTFWHEVTHAILHDMKHPSYSDEAFVTEFSRRLTQVVETAVL